MALKSGMNTGYYGAQGGIMPLFSCGAQALAPSLLTGDGSHMGLWTSVVLHVAALAINMSANIVFFTASHSEGADLGWTWALVSLLFHVLAVLATLTYTGFVKNALSMPTTFTFMLGFFSVALVATAKISFLHASFPADSVEVVLYNLSIVFQALGLASIFANAFACAAKSGGL